MTGASGTVGRHLYTALRAGSRSEMVSVGRRALGDTDHPHRHVTVDFRDAVAVEKARCDLAVDGTGPIEAAVFAAGIDSRYGISLFDPLVAARAMQVNCFAHLQLLRGVIADGASRRRAFPVVVVSSDVVQRPTPDSVVYGASKAALEEALRHVSADLPVRTLVARLAFVGTAMCETAESGAAGENKGTVRRPLLDALAGRVRAFLEAGDQGPGREVWP